MPKIRFGHVFAGLMVLSFMSAFVLPTRNTGVLQGHLQGLFAWVSRPVYSVAGMAKERWAAKRNQDPRSAEVLGRENDELRVAIVNLAGQLQEMRRINQERDRVGSLREFTLPTKVMGADTGGRESVAVAATSRDGVEAGQIVVYPGGVVGRVSRAGVSGAQVRLVTDPEFRLLVRFGRFEQHGNRLDFVQVPLAPQVVLGVGGGGMTIPNLTMKTVRESGLKVGDWALVADTEWPVALQGQRVARVVEIKPARAALFADVRLEPESDLMALDEVLVKTK